jgi:hypothetical protein
MELHKYHIRSMSCINLVVYNNYIYLLYLTVAMVRVNSYGQIALTIARAITDHTRTSKSTDYCPNCTLKCVINYTNSTVITVTIYYSRRQEYRLQL